MPPRKTFRVSRSPSRNRRRSWNQARTLARTSSRRGFASSMPVLIVVLLAVGALAVMTGPVNLTPNKNLNGATTPTVVASLAATPTLKTANVASLASTATPTADPALPAAPTLVPPTPTKPPATLEEAITRVIDKDKTGLGGSAGFGLMIHNLDTGDKFEVNSDKLFESASLYKMFVMLAIYYDVEGGRLSLDDQITLVPDADAHDEDGYTIVTQGNSLPVRELLDHMIVESNNTAGLMLLFQIKVARLQAIVSDLGFKQSDFSDSWNFQVTAQDLDQYFSRLADLKLMGAKDDQPMLDLYSRSVPRDRISADLPPGTKVANKTGTLPGIINDSGIIYLPNGNRVVVSVLTDNVNEEAARQFIADVSSATYNFYNKGQK